MTGILFLIFLVAWGAVPPIFLIVKLRKLSLAEIPLAVIGVIAIEFLLLIVILFMNGITHGGIFRWSFWLS